LLIQFTFLGLRVLVNVNNLPLLSEVIASIADLDVSVFGIGVEVLVLNFKNLTLLVYNISSFSSPELPPS